MVIFYGNATYPYIPANITGGPCAFIRLGLMMFQLNPTSHVRDTREAVQLSEHCDSEVHLLSKSEYISLATSKVGIPGLTIYNSRTVSELACLIAKNINHTSVALAELLLDVWEQEKLSYRTELQLIIYS